MRTAEERFWAKVAPAPIEQCWQWTASLSHKGYGRFLLDGKARIAPRVAYTWLVGPIPTGLQLDHLCHTNDPECVGGDSCLHRRCVNPWHLEPVTNRENALRAARRAAS